MKAGQLHLWTGMRIGEATALRWENVDLERRTIQVRFTHSPEHGETLPKTKSSLRSIKLSQFLVPVLQEQKGKTYGDERSLVFPDKSGNHLTRQHVERQMLHPACDRAGVRHINNHCLRHTNVGLRRAAGEDWFFISRQLGHAKASYSQDLYGHILPEVYDRSCEEFDAFMEPITGTIGKPLLRVAEELPK